jgi:hypothetical protein
VEVLCKCLEELEVDVGVDGKLNCLWILRLELECAFVVLTSISLVVDNGVEVVELFIELL